MRGLGILILVVLFFWVVWPWIARWLKRKAVERAQDYLWQQMGMGGAPGKKDKNRKQNRDSGRSGYGSSYRENYRKTRQQDSTPAHIIPPEYAEDVEFTETIDYSHTETHRTTVKGNKVYHESQISDVEYIEIKKPGGK